MDKMSIQLLKNYHTLSPNERNVLKLSLSYIVDKSNSNLSIYQKYIKSNHFWKVVGDIKSDIKLIEEEEKKSLEAISKEIACQKGVDEGLEAILTQQLKLIKERRILSSEYQMLQSFSYLLHNFEAWSKRKKESEAEKVARTNKLFTIVFSDSCLTIKTGETIGRSTCGIYLSNKHNFSGGGSSNYLLISTATPSSHAGRKIDLIVCNDDHYAIGGNGRFSSLQELDGVFVNEPKAAIIVPTRLKDLDDDYFKTFIALLEWKKHLLDVEKKMTRALIKPDRRDCQYPITCLTAVNTKKRKQCHK